SGKLLAGINPFDFGAGSLISASPYQPFKITCHENCSGYMVNFHPDFFCLHKHRNEVSCNGILFNNIYELPLLTLTPAESQSLQHVVLGMIAEMQRPGAAEFEILLSYLKILLINASRMKVEKRQQPERRADKEPAILNKLKDAIEQNFHALHSPGEYADLLSISTPVLNRTAKSYFSKTLSQLIADRIILEAKRQLYLTSKSVKLIAYELGFNDEFYFSRYFKSKMNVSPQLFRDTVGVNRAEA
ncbi:MAG: helix-turn-helix domain-containing protein, partial [Mucilaginibacter sp.]